MQYITDSQYYEKTYFGQDKLSIFFGGKEKHIVKGFEFGPYMTDFYGIQYCIRGGFTLHTNKSIVEIKKGDLFITPPYMRIKKYFTEESTATYYMHVKGTEVENYLSMFGFSKDNIFLINNTPEHSADLILQIIDLLSTHIEVTISEINAPTIPKTVTCGSSADAATRRMNRRGLFFLFLKPYGAL